jgi:ABC-type multidrug transport system fused ATPase/permease subunit
MGRRTTWVTDKTVAMSSVSPWPLLARLARPHRKATLGFAAALTASTAVALASPVLLGIFVDRLKSGEAVGALALIGIAYVVGGVAATGISLLVTWRSTTLAWKITNTLRTDLARRVLGADRAFLRDHPTGELVSRIDGDVSALTDMLAMFVARVLSVVFVAVGGVMVLAFLAPVLAPVFLVNMLIIAWFMWAHRSAVLAEAEAARDAEGELLSVVEERLSGADDLATLGAGHVAVARVADAAEVMLLTGSATMREQVKVIGKLRTLVAASQVAMMVVGGLLLSRGSITLGTVFVGFRMVAAVGGPIEGIGWRLRELAGAGGSARRIAGLIARPIAEVGERSFPAGGLDVHLDSVGLTYDDGDAEVLSDVSLRVAAGRRLGLVGRTGSGKTSIARLLLRIVPVTSGEVRFGNVPCDTVPEIEFRNRVAAVPQEVQLFPGTVRDNVALFDDDVSDADVEKALAEVGLSDWLLAQTSGLQTRLATTDGGAGLSAGEAQLLALARLFCRQPSVIVLDEATSRIDPETQAQLEAATERLLVGRTAVIIAHRLATLDRCDDIAVLDAGQVVEFGARRDLLANPNSAFARLTRAGSEEWIV